MRAGLLLLPVLALAGCGGGRDLPNALAVLVWDAEEAEGRGDSAAAGALYREGVEAFPEVAQAWASQGEFLRFWKGDRAGAEAAFLRALEAPHWTPKARAFARRGLGELRRAAGDPDGALREFELSLGILPLADTHRSLSAFFASERRDFPRAAAEARAALALSPADPIALLQCAVQLVRAGAREEAERRYGEAMEIAGPEPAHCCVLYNAACYHAVRGARAEALAMLKAFLARPNHRHLARAEVLGDPDLEGLRGDPGFRALLDALP